MVQENLQIFTKYSTTPQNTHHAHGERVTGENRRALKLGSEMLFGTIGRIVEPHGQSDLGVIRITLGDRRRDGRQGC